MAGEITTRTLHDRRRPLAFWVAGLVGYAAMILAVYPTIKNEPGIQDLARNYPKGLMALFGMDTENFDLAQASTFLSTYLYSAIVPLLFVILGAARGAAVVAGEEERGTLDLALAYPVTRRRYLLEQALEVVVELALVGTSLYLTVLIGGPLVGLEIDVVRVGVATAALVGLGLVFAALALLVGALTGAKGVADGVAAGVGVASYLVATLSGLAGWLEPFRYVSPFWYATDRTISQGLSVLDAAVLAGSAAVLLGLAVAAFERRDLTG